MFSSVFFVKKIHNIIHLFFSKLHLSDLQHITHPQRNQAGNSDFQGRKLRERCLETPRKVPTFSEEAFPVINL